MAQLRVSLFGRMQITCDGQPLAAGLDARKVQELLSYLVLHRSKPHTREILADVLWGDASGPQARKYLRQTLWQLQAALKDVCESSDGIVQVDSEWVSISPGADLWTDVGEFEAAYGLVQGRPGNEIAVAESRRVAAAVELCVGGLLEGWYQEWCIFERERLESIYLSMNNKLMAYFESSGQYEEGLGYGLRILKLDRAHESTHRGMMRLYYLAGDRTAAMRQYERCVSALSEELGVGPAHWTVKLYEQIKADALRTPLSSEPGGQVPALPPEAEHGVRLQALMDELRQEVQRYVRAGSASRP